MLVISTSGVLLDREASEALREQIRQIAEQDGDTRVTDLHVWSIGPEIYSALVSVVAHNPATPEEYKTRIPRSLRLVHVAIEIHQCPHHKEAE